MDLRSGFARRGAAAVALAALVATLGACTTDTASGGKGDSGEKRDKQCQDAIELDTPDLKPVSEGSGTETIDTEFGEVKLPKAPKAALGMYTTDVDILTWLRYPLADSQPIRSDSGYETFPCFFPQEELANLDTFTNFPEYDYESVLLAKPDFILNGLGYDKKVVKRLPEIAPTYSVDAFDGRSWLTHFEETAEALGREQYYQDWVTLYEDRVAEVKAKIDDASATTVAPLIDTDKGYRTSCYSGVECQAFEDLGLKIAPIALKNDRQGEELSGEQLGQLKDIDFAFMLRGLGDKADAEFEKRIDEASKNPQWDELNFVKNDGIVGYEMEMTYGSPSGQLAFLDVVEAALTA